MKPYPSPLRRDVPARHRALPSLRSGFSLVDIALTVLILGIAAAAAAPRLNNALQYWQVDGAARRIEADLNYIRAYAKFANTTCNVTFTNGATMSSPKIYTATGVPHTNNSGQPYSVDLSTLGYPVLTVINFNGTSSLTYTANGYPQAGSPLVALTTGTILITRGNISRTITIDPVTGKARRS